MKLVLLVAITLLGLVGAGFYAATMMQREMYAAHTEQTHAIVETARSMALEFQKPVEAATREIARNIQSAAAGSDEISHHIGRLRERDRAGENHALINEKSGSDLVRAGLVLVGQRGLRAAM